LVECAAMYGVFVCVTFAIRSKSNASDIARARSREVMQILFSPPFLSSLLIPRLRMVTWA